MNTFVLKGCGFILLLFLFLPIAIIGFTASQQFSSEIEWSAVLSPLWITIWTSTISLFILLLFGTPLAYWQTQWGSKWKKWGIGITDLPIVLPPSVAGVGLLLLYGRSSGFGVILAEWGISIPFTSIAVIFAQIFVSAPFYIRAVRTGMMEVEAELIESAQVEGADEWEIFTQILIPMSKSAIKSGIILSWARAIGEFGATLMFAGNLFGKTQTMPIAIYLQFENQRPTTYVLSTLLIVVAYGLIVFFSQNNHKN